jgi:hypothetical protein
LIDRASDETKDVGEISDESPSELQIPFIVYDIAASPASLTTSGLTMQETTDTVELAKYLLV